MAIFNNPRTELLGRYLKGLHQLKDSDVAVMLRLLQGNPKFTAKEILNICKDMDITNYERETYNIISRLKEKDLIWKLKRGKWKKKLNSYERVEIKFLKKELEDGIEKLKGELVNLTEQSYYIPKDPKENTKLLETERQLMNTIIQLKKQEFEYKIYLKFKSDMRMATEVPSYRRFMSKLKINDLGFETGKNIDIVLLKKNQKFFIILLCKIYQDEPSSSNFKFYGFQIENDELYSLFEGLIK